MSGPEQTFLETMSAWLVSLPHDLRILYEASSDENLDRKARELAVGAIIYVVSPNDFIADRHDTFLSYCDDCMVLRMALQRIMAASNDDTKAFAERFPEFFEPLAEELGVCKKYLGPLFSWLDGRVDGLRALEYKSKKVPTYLDDDEASELLYEDGLAFRTDYDVTEEKLRDKFKKAASVLQLLQRRKEEEDMKAKA